MSGASVEGAHAQLRALVDRHARRRAGNPQPLGAVAERGALRRAAVLVLFGVLDATPAHAVDAVVARELDVLLVRRADTLTHHAGQIAFPGGGVDPDDLDAAAAALREAEEETGLDPAGVHVLGALPDVEVPVSGFVVTPVLGWWARPSAVRVVDHRESSAVFRAPVADLLDPALRRCAVVLRFGTIHRTPAFLVGSHVVWGFTALILDRLFEDLGWALPWDPSRTVEIPRR